MLLWKRLKLVVPAVLCARIASAQTLTANDFACFGDKFFAGDAYATGFDGHPAPTGNDFQAFINSFAAGESRANCDGSGVPAGGWTNLTPPPGALVKYASSNGSGTACTESNPCSFATGFSQLRDGQPDQLLLKKGDTFNVGQINLTKSSRSMTQYMVIGSYGTGARPKIRSGGQTAFFGNVTSVNQGIAIVGLDIQSGGIGSNQTSGILLFEDWNNVLIEDCYISGFAVNIVIQGIEEFGQPHLDKIKIRRNVIVDYNNTGSGHTQGMYIARVDDLLMEGNVFDSPVSPNNTIFSHNVYDHESCGGGHVFIDNISARSEATGIQFRPGGLMQNNLFLANPINAYHGDSAGGGNSTTRSHRYNVVLDSANVNSVDQRGVGLTIGANGILVENNVVAYNAGGTGQGTVCAFIMTDGGTLRGNYVYSWGLPGSCDGTGFQFENLGGSILSENNRILQTRSGAVWRIPPFNPGGGVHRNNQYTVATTCAANNAFSANESGLDWNAWRALAGESGSTYAAATPADPHVRIGEYMAAIGVAPATLDGFMQRARLQSRDAWDERFTAPAVNRWIRQRLGMPGDPQ